jgi:hypothetical protein
MSNSKGFKYVSGLALGGVLVAAAIGSGGCSAANTIADAAKGCDEFSGGAQSVASLSIDSDTKAFVTAASDIVNLAGNVETAVLNSCIAIDKDMGVTDTWSAKTTTDDKVTEACNQASAKITAVLNAGASANITCGLSVTGGQCTVDANVQATCQASCSGQASCTPPDVTVACDPGQLSGQCSGSCNASAYCEGSASVQAQCQGSCEADCSGTCTPGSLPSVSCTGSCAGNCTGTCDGSTASGTSCKGVCKGKCDAACTVTPGTPIHCEGSCKGTCSGSCKLDANANINCGANVSCKGGCSVQYTAPKCEGEIKPPSCQASASCQASCQSHAEINASCTPPSAKLECQGTVSADITTLTTTLQTNLPAILNAVQVQGPLFVKAVGHLADTGSTLVGNATSLSGKALACAGVAAQAAVSVKASVSVSVSASASVSGSAGGPQG